MTAPSYPITQVAPSVGTVSLALTQDISPDNPVLGDLDLSGGQLHLWDKQTARVQKIRMVLGFGLGEYWLNPDEGIPWFGNIIGTRWGTQRRDIVVGIFRKAFQKTMPDLVEILGLTVDLDRDTRTLRVDYALRFDDGLVLKSADFAPLEIGVG